MKNKRGWGEPQNKIQSGYDNEEVIKIINKNLVVKKFGEKHVCFFRCPKCDKEIEGMNRNRVAANAKTHVASQHQEVWKDEV